MVLCMGFKCSRGSGVRDLRAGETSARAKIRNFKYSATPASMLTINPQQCRLLTP